MLRVGKVVMLKTKSNKLERNYIIIVSTWKKFTLKVPLIFHYAPDFAVLFYRNIVSQNVFCKSFFAA